MQTIIGPQHDSDTRRVLFDFNLRTRNVIEQLDQVLVLDGAHEIKAAKAPYQLDRDASRLRD